MSWREWFLQRVGSLCSCSRLPRLRGFRLLSPKVLNELCWVKALKLWVKYKLGNVSLTLQKAKLYQWAGLDLMSRQLLPGLVLLWTQVLSHLWSVCSVYIVCQFALSAGHWCPFGQICVIHYTCTTTNILWNNEGNRRTLFLKFLVLSHFYVEIISFLLFHVFISCSPKNKFLFTFFFFLLL